MKAIKTSAYALKQWRTERVRIISIICRVIGPNNEKSTAERALAILHFVKITQTIWITVAEVDLYATILRSQISLSLQQNRVYSRWT